MFEKFNAFHCRLHITVHLFTISFWCFLKYTVCIHRVKQRSSSCHHQMHLVKQSLDEFANDFILFLNDDKQHPNFLEIGVGTFRDLWDHYKNKINLHQCYFFLKLFEINA